MAGMQVDFHVVHVNDIQLPWWVSLIGLAVVALVVLLVIRLARRR
jgi:hypothetical protein